MIANNNLQSQRMQKQIQFGYLFEHLRHLQPGDKAHARFPALRCRWFWPGTAFPLAYWEFHCRVIFWSQSLRNSASYSSSFTLHFRQISRQPNVTNAHKKRYTKYLHRCFFCVVDWEQREARVHCISKLALDSGCTA